MVTRDGATLRLVDAPRFWTPQLVEFGPVEQPANEFAFRAEVRAKRFGDWTVNDERYTATLRTTDNSPQAVISALAEALADIPELRRPAAKPEHLILQVSLATCT
jgi:hypothetical protein